MKNNIVFLLATFFLFACQNKSEIIGSTINSEGISSEILVGKIEHQKIWIDYIDAHNNRDLKKIAEINSDKWQGYPPNGTVIEGNEAHIKFLEEWFNSQANPKWTVKWMIVNKGEDENGVLQDWLTSGNDIKFKDEQGNETVEHHIHDIMFEGENIKKIYVYSRPKPQE